MNHLIVKAEGAITTLPLARIVLFVTAISVWSLGVALAQSPTTLTFEHLQPAWTNGYGGLQWTNFDLLDGVNYTNNPSGYFYGVVSRNHIVLNAYTHPAGITRSNGTFNLLSGYLTGAWRDQLRVRTQGFLDNTLLYDKTNIVYSTRPAFVNFNYVGVNRVVFSSSDGYEHGAPFHGFGTHFVMDDLTLSMSSPPSNVSLTIGRTTTNTAWISWVDATHQCRLFESAGLGTNMWRSVTNSAAISNGTNSVNLPKLDGTRLYRLQF